MLEFTIALICMMIVIGGAIKLNADNTLTDLENREWNPENYEEDE